MRYYGFVFRAIFRNNSRVIGGAEGDRTPDLIIANDTLSQLSYCPNDRSLISRNGAEMSSGRPCGMRARKGQRGHEKGRAQWPTL